MKPSETIQRENEVAAKPAGDAFGDWAEKKAAFVVKLLDAEQVMDGTDSVGAESVVTRIAAALREAEGRGAAKAVEEACAVIQKTVEMIAEMIRKHDICDLPSARPALSRIREANNGFADHLLNTEVGVAAVMQSGLRRHFAGTEGEG